MSFNVFYTTVRTIIKRVITYRKLVHLEKIKYNSVREKLRLTSHRTYWDRFRAITCYPIAIFTHYVCHFSQLMVSSLFSGRRVTRREGQMRKVFKNMTHENQLLRKLLYFSLGLSLTYLSFLFLYYNNMLTNYLLIFWTTVLAIFFLLIAPFKESILCLILIALPSLFSSKIRYVLVAYIMFILHFQVLPNIFSNGVIAMRSVGCSFTASREATKRVSTVLVQDIEDFIKSVQQKITEIKDNLHDFLDNFKLAMKLPSLNLKAICNEPTEEEMIACEDKLKLFSVNSHRVYIPLVCPILWRGFAGLCDQTQRSLEMLYNKSKEKVMEEIDKMLCQITFNASVDHQFDYHYVPSKDIKNALKNVGSDWIDRNWWLTYLEYIFDTRVVFLVVISLWVFIKYTISNICQFEGD